MSTFERAIVKADLRKALQTRTFAPLTLFDAGNMVEHLRNGTGSVVSGECEFTFKRTSCNRELGEIANFLFEHDLFPYLLNVDYLSAAQLSPRRLRRYIDLFDPVAFAIPFAHEAVETLARALCLEGVSAKLLVRGFQVNFLEIEALHAKYPGIGMSLDITSICVAQDISSELLRHPLVSHIAVSHGDQISYIESVVKGRVEIVRYTLVQ